MNHYRIIFSVIFSILLNSVYAQRIRPAGKYEIADTTIEVYNVGEFNTIREFKTIHGTNVIQYREFNKLTKKLREEGAFKNGYSSGIWKFYGWTGRLKREVNYDGQVKTYYVKKEGEIEVTEAAAEVFDFEKYKQDSIFVAKYRKKTGGAVVAASSKPATTSTTTTTTTITPTVTTITTTTTEQKKDSTAVAAKVPATTVDSTKKTNTGLFGKLNVFKKLDAKKEGEKKAATDSTKITSAVVEGKPTDVKNDASVAKTALVAPAATPAPAKKEEVKPAPAVVSKPAEPKKAAAPAATPAPAKKEEVKPAPAVVNKPAEPKKETAPAATPAPAKKEEVKPAPAVVSKPAEPKKETAPAAKPAPVKKEESKPASAVVSKPAESKKETAPAAKPMPVKKEADAKPAPVVASKPVEPKKESPAAAPSKNQVLKGSMESGKNKTVVNSTTNTVQKNGSQQQASSTKNTAKPVVAVENKQPKTVLDTTTQKINELLTQKLLALKKENDRLEQVLKAQKKDSLSADSVKRGLKSLTIPAEKKEKSSTAGASK